MRRPSYTLTHYAESRRSAPGERRSAAGTARHATSTLYARWQCSTWHGSACHTWPGPAAHARERADCSACGAREREHALVLRQPVVVGTKQPNPLGWGKTTARLPARVGEQVVRLRAGEQSGFFGARRARRLRGLGARPGDAAYEVPCTRRVQRRQPAGCPDLLHQGRGPARVRALAWPALRRRNDVRAGRQRLECRRIGAGEIVGRLPRRRGADQMCGGEQAHERPPTPREPNCGGGARRGRTRPLGAI